MIDSDSDLSTAEWKERLGPTLSVSLRETSEEMTKARPVQSWLHEASYEAAQDVARTTGSQAQGMGYMYMMDSLEATVPNLLAAVRDLTDGYGHVDLHWRPLSPGFSRLYVDFDWDTSVDVFIRLDEATADDARDGLRTVAEALPKGTPYPNRPNEATGLVAHDGNCVAARIHEHLGEKESTYRSVSLIPKNGDASDPMSPSDAVRALLDIFS